MDTKTKEKLIESPFKTEIKLCPHSDSNCHVYNDGVCMHVKQKECSDGLIQLECAAKKIIWIMDKYK